MKQIQKWTLAMLEDALATASHNSPASPPPDFPVIIAQLTDVIAKAKTAAVNQAADRGSAASALRAARAALFSEYLVPIRDIAVGRLTDVPNVNQLFRIPPRGAHRTTLIKEANVILEHATQYKDIFIASGLPATFLDQFSAAITAVEQAGAVHTNIRGDRQKATEQLQEALTEGKQFVRGLNGIMQPAFAKSKDVLAAWNSARRIRKTHGTVGSATPATSQTVVPSQSLVTATAKPNTPQLSTSQPGTSQSGVPQSSTPQAVAA
jgi:hypothetical protein